MTKLIGFAVLIIQNVCKVNVLTTILSIVSLQNLEVGFYFGLQFLVFELGSVFGSLIYFAFETNSNLFVFYIFSVICYAMISYSISRDLSEDHDEIDNYDWKLWIDIVRVRVMFYIVLQNEFYFFFNHLRSSIIYLHYSFSNFWFFEPWHRHSNHFINAANLPNKFVPSLQVLTSNKKQSLYRIRSHIPVLSLDALNDSLRR